MTSITSATSAIVTSGNATSTTHAYPGGATSPVNAASGSATSTTHAYPGSATLPTAATSESATSTTTATSGSATALHHLFQICEKCHSEVPEKNWILHSFGCNRLLKTLNNNTSEADNTNDNVKKQKFIDNKPETDQTLPIEQLPTMDPNSLMPENEEKTHWLCFFCTRINSIQDIECRTCGMHGVDEDGFEFPRPQQTLCLNDWN